MSFHVRLNRRVLHIAVVPFLVVLVLLNGTVWWLVGRAYVGALREVTRDGLAQLDSRIRGATERLRVIASLPATESLLSSAGRAKGAQQRRNHVDAMATEWEKIGRDDMRVREVLDNTVGETLRSVCADDPMIRSLLVTDAEGGLLAASEKPPVYDFSRLPWWALATTASNAAAVSEGFVAPGLIGISVPVRDATKGTLKGTLRAELDILGLTAGMQTESCDESVGLFVVGTLVVPLNDEATRLVESQSAVVAAIARKKAGWSRGMRFRGHALDAGILWGEPVHLVVTRKEGPSLVLMLAGSVALIIVSVYSAKRWNSYFERVFRNQVVDPHSELLEAGDWILRTALGRPSVLQAGTDAAGDSNRITPDASPLQKDLQKWLHRLVEDLQDEYAAQTYEMQRDLQLARDFQLAYIDRAYPKIPLVHIEGRLRLDFYHRYEPALALGGDFYNILTLGPDCAGVFVSDVMGHGTRSALITAIIRTLIDDLAAQGRNARHFLTEMNKLFCGLLTSVPSPLFASACYFVADTTARVATYSSAGHPAPFHVRRSVGRITRMEVPMPRGAALGMIPDEKYTGGYCRLIDGDLFLFFTDGVYEAHNIHGEEFGIARMEEVLRRMMYKSAKEIVDGMMDAITTFVSYEPIMDDICLVAVEVTTKSVL